MPPVVAAIGEAKDRPEESFLLHEKLLRLAVDSLADADVLDPLPVHINPIWFFARPIVMQRAGDSDRHVRAVWYRQGDSMWRIRTNVAGVPGSGTVNVKQVGPTLPTIGCVGPIGSIASLMRRSGSSAVAWCGVTDCAADHRSSFIRQESWKGLPLWGEYLV